jgi:hypothetical protein
MSFSSISRRIVFLVLTGFVCVLILVWANDMLSPTLHLGYSIATPQYTQAKAAGMFDAKLDQQFWTEFAVEALLIVILAVIVMLGIRQLLARIHYLEGFMLLCASCKKVRITKDEWVSLEEYLHQRSDVRISHTFCPECSAKIQHAPARKASP